MNAEHEFDIGRGGLFRIPRLPAEPDKMGPGEFLNFFRDIWHINGIAVGDIDCGTAHRRTEQLVVPPTSERPTAVVMNYNYLPASRTKITDWEEYVIFATSSQVLTLVPRLRFSCFKWGFMLGDDSYSHVEDPDGGWLVAGEETNDAYATPTPNHLAHLGQITADFVELVSA